MRAGSLVVAVALTLWLSQSETPRAQGTPILAAMADELERSMTSLRLANQPAPYFIEYEVEDRASTRATARLGGLVEDLSGRSRTLRVGVRVGDYAFDSSLFNAPVGGGVLQLQADGSTSAPLDEDYDAMRRQIWLATDSAYRRAVSLFARKRAAFQNRVAGTTLPDFSRERALETLLSAPSAGAVDRVWPERARQISAVFASVREIEGSEVSVSHTSGTRYYLNSEGFKVVAPIQLAWLRVSADAQARDGMTVRDAFTLVEANLDALPPVQDLVARARQMAERLRSERSAPIGEEYTGPVLVEGQASAELVLQVLVPAMLARRPSEFVGRGGGRGGGQLTPFARRIGLRVLSEPFSVSDTPSLREFGGRPVPGAYVVDDHGIRAKDVTLVERGRLATLIAGRAPLPRLPQSSGHTRGGDVQPGVFQIQSAEAVSASDVKRRYLDLLEAQEKPFGYIIRGLASPADAPGGGPGTGPMIFQAVRVTPEGREQSVRGLRLGAVLPAAFRDLLEASRERTLYNVRATATDAASVLVPNLIFEELDVQQSREITQKPPIVRSPLDN